MAFVLFLDLAQLPVDFVDAQVHGGVHVLVVVDDGRDLVVGIGGDVDFAHVVEAVLVEDNLDVRDAVEVALKFLEFLARVVLHLVGDFDVLGRDSNSHDLSLVAIAHTLTPLGAAANDQCSRPYVNGTAGRYIPCSRRSALYASRSLRERIFLAVMPTSYS